MGNQHDIIELNGYKYDAKTGARLGVAGVPKAPRLPQSVDGFARPVQKPTLSPQAPARPSVTPKTPTPSHSLHAKTSKSKTLMRSAVKKPLPNKAMNDFAAPIQKRTFTDPNRLDRAKTAEKSPQVSKFGITKTLAEVNVKTAPQEVNPHADDTAEKRTLLPLSPFDMALQNAKSHEQQPIDAKKERKGILKKLRVTSKSASVALGAFVIVGGLTFFAKQQMPQIAVQLAAARAGVEAKLPGYKPSGFSLAGPIEYSSGEITLAYASNSDERNYKVTQKTSDWNSQSLLENFITASDKSYQTFEDKGKTIYIYDGNNATWVSGGVWYQVEGESSLSSDQLLRIASGL